MLVLTLRVALVILSLALALMVVVAPLVAILLLTGIPLLPLPILTSLCPGSTLMVLLPVLLILLIHRLSPDCR